MTEEGGHLQLQRGHFQLYHSFLPNYAVKINIIRVKVIKGLNKEMRDCSENDGVLISNHSIDHVTKSALPEFQRITTVARLSQLTHATHCTSRQGIAYRLVVSGIRAVPFGASWP